MSQQWKCRACGGTYADTQPDGTIYFHACAPQPPNAQGVQQEVVNKRDERVAADAKGRPSGIQAAGAGVQAVGVTPLLQPAWLTDLQQRVATIAAGG